MALEITSLRAPKFYLRKQDIQAHFSQKMGAFPSAHNETVKAVWHLVPYLQQGKLDYRVSVESDGSVFNPIFATNYLGALKLITLSL